MSTVRNVDGFIDYCDGLSVGGWAADQGDPRLPRLSVSVNGVRVGEMTPDIDRPGLQEVGIRNGAGFRFVFPTPLDADSVVEVRTSNGQHLHRSPWPYVHDPLRVLFSDVAQARASLARHFLSGEGIEVGALHNPLVVPPAARVSYVDRFDREALRAQYPSLDESAMVVPDIIDDGETLATIGPGTQDFVIASHFLEHCQDPVGFLQNCGRVLKQRGTLYLAVPDKERTFDKDRLLTRLDHLREDHLFGPERSRRAHYVEFVEFVNKEPGPEIYRRASELDRTSYSIHFHVWTKESFLEFLGYACREFALPLEVVVCLANYTEILCILRKKER